jgi:RNA polymerase sigma-70 factor (ECF subfamily)
MIESVREPEVSFAPGAAMTPRPTFDDMVNRYQTEIYRYAMQLTRNRADADDLYQETLIKAFRAFDRLDGTANHRAWLYKIATNTFLTSRRRVNREAPLDEAAELAIPDEPSDRAASLDARDLLREISAFVNLLPAKQRIALILRKYQGLGYREIAANLETTEGAARANVHEAMRKLRDRFDCRLSAIG